MKNSINWRKFNLWRSQGNHANWISFLVIAFVVFSKSILFYFFVNHNLLFSSLWENPGAFWIFYLPFITLATSIASLTFLTKRKYWLLIVSVIIDIWLIANLWYFRSYDRLIDFRTIFMVNNLNDGYWDSIFLYYEHTDWLFLATSLILGAAQWIFKTDKRSWKHTLIILCLSIISYYGGNFLLKDLNIFGTYVPKTSEIEDIDAGIKQELNTYLAPAEDVHPTGNVCIVIVESLESWVINPYSMPNLYKFTQQQNVLYAPNMIKQVGGGMSSDAQLIINTGLLPTYRGAVSHDYQNNVYPSIASLYDTLTLSLTAHELDNCWFQRAMNKAYHFDVAWSRPYNDTIVFDYTKQAIKNGFKYVQMCTLSTHSPFRRIARFSNLSFSSEIPQFLGDYIRSFNVLDASMGDFLESIQSDSTLQNTTIIFTSDHTIFSKEKHTQYHNICQKYNLPYNIKDGNNIPFIIYSPHIKENSRVEETLYQMDIYPTILSLIGCKNYFWQGFGIDILNQGARNNRLISPEVASHSSDLMIRSDYFKEVTDSLNITFKDYTPIVE